MLLLGFTLVLQACTTIKQPTAKNDLVGTLVIDESLYVGDNINSSLTQSITNSTIILANESYVVGRKFYSALGKTCRKLNTENKEYKVFCLDQNGKWYETKPILARYSESNL